MHAGRVRYAFSPFRARAAAVLRSPAFLVALPADLPLAPCWARPHTQAHAHAGTRAHTLTPAHTRTHTYARPRGYARTRQRMCSRARRAVAPLCCVLVSLARNPRQALCIPRLPHALTMPYGPGSPIFRAFMRVEGVRYRRKADFGGFSHSHSLRTPYSWGFAGCLCFLYALC